MYARLHDEAHYLAQADSVTLQQVIRYPLSESELRPTSLLQSFAVERQKTRLGGCV